MVDVVEPQRNLPVRQADEGRVTTGLSRSPGPAHLNPSLAGEELTNIRGRIDRSLPFDQVIAGSGLSPAQIAQLRDIYDNAKDLPLGERFDRREQRIRDCGQDIRALIPLLRERGELLNKLHELATTTTLFSVERRSGFTPDGKPESAVELERRRADYLVDVIRHSVDTTELVQGPNALCTDASAVSEIDRGEFLRLACEYGIAGCVEVTSGKSMIALPEYHTRSVASAFADLSSIRSTRPSAGMLNFLTALEGLVVPENGLQTGSYWYQYTALVEHLTGRKHICAGELAHVRRESDGTTTVLDVAEAGTRRASEFVVEDLSSRDGGRFLVDLKWSHEGAFAGSENVEHGRHMLVARGVEYRAPDGRLLTQADLQSGRMNKTRFIVCDNPIGQYVHQATGTTYAEGTRLGSTNDNDPWFIVGEGRSVLIREDVFNANLKTVIIDGEGDFVYDPVTDSQIQPVGVGIVDHGEIHFIRIVETGATEEKASARETQVTRSIPLRLGGGETSTPQNRADERNLHRNVQQRWRIDRTGRARQGGEVDSIVDSDPGVVVGGTEPKPREASQFGGDERRGTDEGGTEAPPPQSRSSLVSNVWTWGVDPKKGIRPT